MVLPWLKSINGSLLLNDREIKNEKWFLLGLSKQRFKNLCVVIDKVRAQAHQKRVSSLSLCLFSVLLVTRYYLIYFV